MASGRTLKVEIIGDSSSLERALGRSGDAATGFGSKFGKAAKAVGVAAVAGGAAVAAGFVYTLKRGFDELADSQKVMAQTQAVIKSTGGTANVSAKQVDSLATSLSQISGVDDEVIGAGENMLLTFTNIRNEVGKGNDIFNQSTKTLLDMSTALGTDMNKSAIQLGKALNDPIKGITALSRVGVTFTEGQKATIKSMVEAGNTMGAQKLILAELNKEFGGSAEAAGKTLPGQLAKLRNAFDEVAGRIAAKLLPALTQAIAFVNDNWPQISAVMEQVANVIIGAAGRAVAFIRTNWQQIKAIAEAVFGGARDAAQKFASFISTDLGQKLAAGAAGLAVLAAAALKLAPAIKAANVALLAMKANPIFIALIPLGIALGAVTQDFIKSKLAAAELAKQWDAAAGSARGLKDAQDALKNSSLAVKEAQLAHEESLNNLNKAIEAYNVAVKASGPNSQAAKDAQFALRDANLAVERTSLGVTAAVKGQADAHRANNEALNASRQQILVLVDEYAKLNGTFAQTGNADNFARKMMEVAAQAGATALKLKDVSPAASAAQAKAALLATAAADLAEKLGRVPTRKEIIAEARTVNFDKFYADILALESKIKGTAGTAKEWGAVLGGALGDGVAAGVRARVPVVLEAVRTLMILSRAAAGAAAGEGSPAKEWIPLGRHIVEGVETGVTEKQKDLHAKLKAMLADPTTLAYVGQAGNVLGQSATREIINGIIGVTPSLASQLRKSLKDATDSGLAAAKQRITDAKSGFAAAFENLASTALAAFDKINAKQTQAQKDLARMQAEDAKKQVDDAVTAAQAALKAAQDAAIPVTTIDEAGKATTTGPTPEQIKAVEDAKAALTAALRAQKEAELEVTIQGEQDKLAAKRAAFEEDLAQLQTWAEKHAGKHKLLLDRIKELWKKYGIEGQNWGRNLGEKIAQGLRDALPEIIKAAEEVGNAIKNRTKSGSPTKEGPLSTFDMTDAGFALIENYSKGIAAATKSINASFSDLGLGRSPGLAASMGSRQSVSHTHIYLDGKEVADVVTAHQITTGRHGGLTADA